MIKRIIKKLKNLFKNKFYSLNKICELKLNSLNNNKMINQNLHLLYNNKKIRSYNTNLSRLNNLERRAGDLL